MPPKTLKLFPPPAGVQPEGTEIYKELEPGKSVEGASWAGRADAEAEIDASRQRLHHQGRTAVESHPGP